MGDVQTACIWKVVSQGKATIQTLAAWHEESWHQSLDTESQNILWTYRKRDPVNYIIGASRVVRKLGLHQIIDARERRELKNTVQ